MVSVAFNQDCTSLAIGSKGGYQIFSLNNVVNNVDQINRVYLNDVDKDTYIVERLFSSSLIVVVNRRNPCMLKVCHFKKGTEICNYSYHSDILSIKLNRQRLVVCLAGSYYIHNIRDMKVIHTLEDTAHNPLGLCALSVSNDSGYIAYPGSTQNGSLEVFDSMTMTPVMHIDAHNNPLAAVAFSYKSDMVATASSKGTVVRIFSMSDGAKLFEFRRGLSRCVTISSLAFSQDGLFLSASSNTETVHIFKLCPKATASDHQEDSGWTNYVTSAFKSSAASLIPSTVTEVFSAWRAFATARLSHGSKHTVCGIASIKKIPYIIVADVEGMVHVYKLNVDIGGECELVTTRRLETLNDEDDLDDSFSDADDNQNITKSPPVSPNSILQTEKLLSDASYAYKLKREKRMGPSTASQELDELIDNLPAGDGKGSPEMMEKLKLDDPSEFPPMK